MRFRDAFEMYVLSLPVVSDVHLWFSLQRAVREGYMEVIRANGWPTKYRLTDKGEEGARMALASKDGAECMQSAGALYAEGVP